MLKRIMSALAAVVLLVSGLAFNPATAFAADNVITADTDTYTNGTITYRIRWDNTNCQAYTLNGCVGLDGAKLSYIDITSTDGEILFNYSPTGSNPLGYYDTYGDGDSCLKEYTGEGGYTGTLTHYSLTHKRWTPNANSSGFKNLNRFITRVDYNPPGSGQNQYFRSIALNPYGISTASNLCNP